MSLIFLCLLQGIRTDNFMLQQQQQQQQMLQQQLQQQQLQQQQQNVGSFQCYDRKHLNGCS